VTSRPRGRVLDAAKLYEPTPRERTVRAALRAMAADAPAGRCFGYARVSSDEQVERGQSLDVQRSQLTGWAMQHGRTLEAIIVEPGVSGGVPFNERPGGGKLWADLRKGDVLVAAKLDRVFRSSSDCLAVVEAFKARGVSLFLLDLNGGADDVSGNGIARLFLTIVSAFAEFERDRIGERIRQAKAKQRRDGKYSGGIPAFGFRRVGKRLVEDEDQQAAIRRIQRLAAKGMSPYKISADLAERGISLTHMGVRAVLRRAAP
jgi:putative DNA-invertase from lambdoid prophage Rac